MWANLHTRTVEAQDQSECMHRHAWAKLCAYRGIITMQAPIDCTIGGGGQYVTSFVSAPCCPVSCATAIICDNNYSYTGHQLWVSVTRSLKRLSISPRGCVQTTTEHQNKLLRTINPTTGNLINTSTGPKMPQGKASRRVAVQLSL